MMLTDKEKMMAEALQQCPFTSCLTWCCLATHAAARHRGCGTTLGTSTSTAGASPVFQAPHAAMPEAATQALTTIQVLASPAVTDSLSDPWHTHGQPDRPEDHDDGYSAIIHDVQHDVQMLKKVLTQLQDIGEPSTIVHVAYKYMQIVEGKPVDQTKPVNIVITVPRKESAQEIAEKKAMLSALAASEGL
jgi:hypothetical protein